MKKIIWPFLCVLALAIPAFGQGWSMTTWFVQTIAVQHSRLDRIKAHQPDPPLRGYIDLVWQEPKPIGYGYDLRIQGWGFECGQLDVDTVDLHMAGFIKDITSLVVHYPRHDLLIDPGLSAWCPVGIPSDAGLDLTIDLGSLLPNTYDIKLRLWTADGQFHDTNVVAMRID